MAPHEIHEVRERTEADAFAAACSQARRVAVLTSVDALLGWDEQTMMPRDAGGYRAEQAAALAALAHRERTDPRQGDRLARLASGSLADHGTPDERATIRLLGKDFARQSRLPHRLVEELARTRVEAQQAWVAARAASDWRMLEPWLRKMFDLKREQAACQEPDLDPYDALLDEYEPGARSRAFWEWCFPQARAAFPAALGDIDAAAVHEALLTVKPSFIRVEADEVTYNLHVMLRFDLERAVVQGELPIGDLPAAWDERFERDFGMRPTSAAEGVLQDIHWSAGLIGYFPTYTLGTMYAAQLMAAAEERLPGLPARFAAGEFGDLRHWLRREVHAAGRLLESEPLVEQVTGRTVSEAWLLESLGRRYGPVHGL